MEQTHFLEIASPGTASKSQLLIRNDEARPGVVQAKKLRLDFYHDFLTVCGCGKVGLIQFNARVFQFGPSELNPDWVFSWDEWLGDHRGWNCGALGHGEIRPGQVVLSVEQQQFLDDVFGRTPQGFWVNFMLDDFGRNI